MNVNVKACLVDSGEGFTSHCNSVKAVAESENRTAEMIFIPRQLNRVISQRRKLQKTSISEMTHKTVW